MFARAGFVYDALASVNKFNIGADQMQLFILSVHFFYKHRTPPPHKIMCHCLEMVPGNYFTLLRWSAQSPDHSLIKHLRDEVKWDVRSGHAIESAESRLSGQYRSKSLWNISHTLLNQCLQ